MAHHVVKFEGLYRLEKGLKKRLNMDAVKRVVQKNGDQLNERAKENTENAFVKGYSHGDTARSITTEIRDGGMTAVVEPKTEYAAYVELGTRKMTAEPYLKPAWEVQKEQFKKDLDRLTR